MLRRLTAKAAGRLSDQSGYFLIELLVAIVLFMVVLTSFTTSFTASLNAENRINNENALIDQTDAIKSWAMAYLAPADDPPVAASSTSVEFTSNGSCYTLNYTSSNSTIWEASASSCSGINSANQVTLASDATLATGTNFLTYKDVNGNTISNPSGSLSSIKEVDVSVQLKDINNRAATVTRTLAFTLGGIYNTNG